MRPEKLDKRRSRIVARLAADRRHFVRGQLSLNGRYLAENGWEYQCKVIDMSPGGILLTSEFVPEISEQVVLLIEDIGRVQGEIVRHTDGGYAVSVRTTSRKKSQLASKLTWLINAERLGLKDDRATERKPHTGTVYLELRDGTRFQASAIDLSVTGMAIQSTEHICLGERVKVGRLNGTVTRLLATGFAVRFDPPEPKPKDE